MSIPIKIKGNIQNLDKKEKNKPDTSTEDNDYGANVRIVGDSGSRIPRGKNKEINVKNNII